MGLRLTTQDTGLLAAILLIVLLIPTAAYMSIMSSVEKLVRVDAEQTSHDWMDFLMKNLPDIENIAGGEAPSDRSLEFIKVARNAGRVFRFKIFDSEGQVRLVSSELVNVGISNENIAKQKPAAFRTLKAGKVYTVVKDGNPPHRPALYSETYLPVFKQGKMVAITEVYVDQSGKRKLYRTHFLFVSLSLATTIALSLGLLAGLFYWRTRQKRKADERIAYLARHDAMTGLANRAHFMEKLATEISSVSDISDMIAIHYLDLDRFKEINDTLGHDAGDEVITEVARRLKNASGKRDIIARFGGDEFVIAQIGVTRVEDAEQYAQTIIESMEETFMLDGHNYASTCSIGISISPFDGKHVHKLIKRADMALYRVKSGGRNGFLRFLPEMDVEIEARKKLETLIRNAAFDETFQLKFQPIYNFETEQLETFEALLRLPIDEENEISPAVFVPIAEDMGLIQKIGAWVIEDACKTAATWPESCSVAVNLSPLQFRSGDLFEIVEKALKVSGLQAGRLELEVTENLVQKDTDSVLDQLRKLKEIGVKVVMDDFGAGSYSLNYLWEFPFDKIKIDMSLVQTLKQTGKEIEVILSTIASLGHTLNMSVTVEGIESTQQVELLGRVSCDQVQGFFFGHPVSEADIPPLMLKRFRDEAGQLTDGSDHQEVGEQSNYQLKK